MTDLRRVVIINDTAIARGGAEKLALQLAQGVAERGVNLTFFSGDDQKNESLEALGVDIISVGGKPLLKSRRAVVDGIYHREAVKRLRGLIREIDHPGVVYHVHAWSQILSPSIFDALAPVAARSVLTAHDFFIVCPNGNFSIYPKSEQCMFKPMSVQCMASHCDKRNYAHKIWRLGRQAMLKSKLDFQRAPLTVLAPQAGMIPFLARGGIPENQIRVVTNPANRLVSERVNAEANDEILYVGRIEPEKGVDLLASVARDAGAKLRVIGAGDDEAAVRRAYPDAIFQGWSEPKEIAEALGKARFFVMPSRCTEPFGLAAAEALRAGVPVMTSQSCLIGEDVRRKGMGDICNIFDREAFLNKIMQWLHDDDAVQSMSIAAHEGAVEIAQTESAWIDNHIALYEEFASSAALQ